MGIVDDSSIVTSVPLRHITGYDSLLRKKYADLLPEEGHQYLNNISSAAMNKVKVLIKIRQKDTIISNNKRNPVILLMGVKMKISTKGRYGLVALVDMAIYGERDYINLKSISERQGIPDKYLEQIFIPLKRAGLIDSLRGAQGGYRLSRAADKITVKDVLNSLEGPLAPVDCIVDAKGERCNQFDCCVTRVLWQKIMEELNSVTDAISLADLAKLFKESQKGSIEVIS